MLLDPLEHELAERLAEAGERARSSKSAAPNGAFAAELRDRLMTAASDRLAVGDRAGDRAGDSAGDRTGDRAGDREQIRVAWSLPSFFRVPRLLPVAVASLLLIAGVVAARELYVAIGNRPDATPKPVPSVVAVLPTESAGEPLFVASLDGSSAPSTAALPGHTAVPSAKPTAKPTAKPSPAPTPGLVALSLAASGCDGGVVLEWSAYEGDFFNHYTTLRNTTNNVPKAYPPQGGAVDPGGNYTTIVGKTSAVDDGVAAGTTYYYRTMAFNAEDVVIGASSVMSAVAAPVASLGSLGAAPVAEGTDLTWTPYAGSEACFTWYKIAYSESNPSPSYLSGDPYLAAISSQATGSYVASSAELLSGKTYYLRVQALRSTALGLFVASQSDVATYLVP